MIYVTGDTHGEIERFSNRRMKKLGLELGDKDYVIVCGDFGLCWKKDGTFEYNCKFFADKKYTILWVQGNHENYDMIAEYPIEEWHGGKVRHIVRDKVILLERGQVFEIDGKTFFTFGGAASHDIQGGVLDKEDIDYEYERQKAIERGLPFRIKNVSWWEQELPTMEEINEGRRNLEKHNNRVDYVITHCCSSPFQEAISKIYPAFYKPDVLTDYFQEIDEKVEFKHWFFGHYHMDKELDAKHTLLYHGILPVEEPESIAKVPVAGQPKYRLGDIVRMKLDEGEKVGIIQVVDSRGALDEDEGPAYDILVKNECLYKHIWESEIIGKEN